MDIRIPNLSEGVNQGTVVSIMVSVGDTISKDQTVLELETDKAVAPIPAEVGGTITKILINEGDTVSVGQPIFSLDSNGAAAPAATEAAPQAPQAPAAPAAPQAPTPTQGAPVYQTPPPAGIPAAASPTVRKIARELGIDLSRVRGTEAGGRITIHDLRDYVQYLQSPQNTASQAPAGATVVNSEAAPKESIDFSKWGEVKKEKLSSLRKVISDRMAESWRTIPHVTQFDEADITELLALRKKSLPKFEKKGVRPTITSFLLQAIVTALKEFPVFNSSLDEAAGEIVYKSYYHLGVAVDTEAGLIVPVLRDVDKKSVLEITNDLNELAQKARDRKVAVEDLKGGTFTVSNLGGLGVGPFTPIINKPEVAILGIGKGAQKTLTVNKKNELRTVMPLAVSYDHRIIDGADGARFVRRMADAIENFDASNLGV